MAADKKKTCVCNPISCRGPGTEPCNNYQCTQCRACCHPDCKGCEKKCTDGENCKCCTPICGCPTNCYENGTSNCKGIENNKCTRCQTKCQKGKPCICYRCSCGTQCNGFLCACCYFCNPGKCKRKGTCDGYVLGKCNADRGCQGHGTYNSKGEPVYVDKCKCGPKDEATKCTCFPDDKKCRCIRGEPDGHGNCLIKCDLCGKLCSQHSYIHEGSIVVASLAIVMIIIIVWSKHRDKFLKVFYELRGYFSRAPKHSSAYTNNLFGDKIPEEGNIERYPGFRAMPYAGLS